MKKMLVIALISVIVFGCGKSKNENPQDKQLLTQEEITKVATDAKTFFRIIPDKMPGSEANTPEMVALGKKLYFEKKLSSDNTISCNSCHLLDNNGPGVDNKPTSSGVGGKLGTRNSPTVLNAGFHFVQFWDGRAKDLTEQAKGPILNPVEMAMASEKDVVKKISEIAEYKEMFSKAFPKDASPITYDNLAKAIAAFEMTLITHDRFDNFLNGNLTALTQEELKGLDLFIKTGCTTCHTGALMGGTLYQKMGLVNPYSDKTDKGRFDITKQDADMFMFKVPSLRNIALTAPYFHDGKSATLEDAVSQMAWLQLNKKLTAEDSKLITKFLGSLTDKDREKK